MTAILILLFTLSMLAVTANAINRGFLETETELASADLSRVISAVAYESEALSKTVADYAVWDDTWDYARGRGPGFWEDNFAASTFMNLDLCGVVLLDTAGKVLNSRGYDRANRSFCELPPDIDLSPAAKEGGPGHGEAAFLSVKSVPTLYRANAILKTDGSGPVAGTLVMFNTLDSDFVKRISERTNVAAERFSDPLPSGLSDTRETESMRAGLFPDPTTDAILGYVSFLDAAGVPLFAIRTRTPRSLLLEEARMLKGTLTIYGILALVFLALVNVAYGVWFAAPMARLESEVDSCGLESAESASVFEPLSRRSDEIGHIARSIRAMHVRVLSAHDVVRRLNADLERLIGERTSALLNANSELTIFKKILESTSEAVIITGMDGSIIELNDAMCRMTGYAREEMIGRNSRMFKSGRHGGDFYRMLWEELLAAGHWEGEIWDRKKDGTVYPKWQTINVIRDEKGERTNYIGVSTDVTLIKEAEEKLNQLAYYDPLTGLPNRMLFSDRVERGIASARRQGYRFAVLYLDLDRFKHVNDSLGHVAGDTLLVQATDRMKDCLRESDTLCRIGGDEFGFVLQNLNRDESAGVVAQKLVTRLSQRFEVNGSDVYIGASVGISIYPKDGADTDTLIRKADGALFIAKEEGKGLYRYASGEMERVNRGRLEIESNMHRALERSEFVIHYQPQVSIEAAAPGLAHGLTGCEALIRWESEPGVLVSPGEFLPLAEDSGFIAPLGNWVLLEACRDAKRWEDAGRPVQVSVNVAMRQFDNGNFENMVAAVLEATGLSPNLLKLEITESGFMRNIQRVTETMKKIRETGVTFAIDDFGTGYASMNYLNTLPVSALKVDQSFVRSLDEDGSGGDIVAAILSMSKAFGLTSIAEGVETFHQLERLRQLGCDVAQGYLVSRPLSREAFENFIGLG